MANTNPQRLKNRVPLLLSDTELEQLDALCAARADDEGAPSRNRVVRSLIRERHARLTATKEHSE